MFTSLTTGQQSALTALATRTGESTHVTARSLGFSASTLNSLVRKGLVERVDMLDIDMVTKGHYAITELGEHVLTPLAERPAHQSHATTEQAIQAVDFHGYEVNNVGHGYVSNNYGEALTFGYSPDADTYVVEHSGEVVSTHDTPAQMLAHVAHLRSVAYVAMRNEHRPLPLTLVTVDHFALITVETDLCTYVVNMYTCDLLATIRY